MKKGISPLISHTLLIAIGIVALSFLTMFVFDIFNNISEQQMNSEEQYISEVLTDSVSDLYLLSLKSDYTPDKKETVNISKIALLLSSSSDYTLEAGDKKIKIIGSSSTYEKTLPFEIDVEGASKLPGNLILQRTNDKGKITDKIILVD